MTTSKTETFQTRWPEYASLFLPDDGDPFHVATNQELIALCRTVETGNSLGIALAKSVLDQLLNLPSGERIEALRYAYLEKQKGK